MKRLSYCQKALFQTQPQSNLSNGQSHNRRSHSKILNVNVLNHKLKFFLLSMENWKMYEEYKLPS